VINGVNFTEVTAVKFGGGKDAAGFAITGQNQIQARPDPRLVHLLRRLSTVKVEGLHMPFPPNYNQNRKDRERAKNQKALEKQARREAKNRDRKPDEAEEPAAGDAAAAKEKQ
jgi:hypothetical protein